MKISEILLKYKSDKNHGTITNIYSDLDSWSLCDNPPLKLGHTYGDSYDEIFELFNRNDSITFLEIGIQKGGSLLAWKDYFPNANIFGVDIVDNILPEYRKDYFTYIISDIKNESVIEQFTDIMFDIIIDDGSHYLSDVFVVKNYLKKLKNNGVLIIEDCQQPEYWLSEIQKITPNNFTITTKDLRHLNSYDNFLIVITKNDNN